MGVLLKNSELTQSLIERQQEHVIAEAGRPIRYG